MQVVRDLSLPQACRAYLPTDPSFTQQKSHYQRGGNVLLVSGLLCTAFGPLGTYAARSLAPNKLSALTGKRMAVALAVFGVSASFLGICLKGVAAYSQFWQDPEWITERLEGQNGWLRIIQDQGLAHLPASDREQLEQLGENQGFLYTLLQAEAGDALQSEEAFTAYRERHGNDDTVLRRVSAEMAEGEKERLGREWARAVELGRIDTLLHAQYGAIPDGLRGQVDAQELVDGLELRINSNGEFARLALLGQIDVYPRPAVLPEAMQILKDRVKRELFRYGAANGMVQQYLRINRTEWVEAVLERALLLSKDEGIAGPHFTSGFIRYLNDERRDSLRKVVREGDIGRLRRLGLCALWFSERRLNMSIDEQVELVKNVLDKEGFAKTREFVNSIYGEKKVPAKIRAALSPQIK